MPQHNGHSIHYEVNARNCNAIAQGFVPCRIRGTGNIRPVIRKALEALTLQRCQSSNQVRTLDHTLIFAHMRPCEPDCKEALAWAKELQDFFTAHYYTCTPQILGSLAESYAGGGSMTENIDKVGGAGTGAFAKEVIDIYIGKQV